MSPERYHKIRSVLSRRQTDLTVCLEDVHKPHNVAAIMRTCDAVGIHQLHVLWDTKAQIRRGTAKGSHLWVKAKSHDSTPNAINAFKHQDMQVLVTHLSDDAVDYRDIDYTQPTAIILGNEKQGASNDAIQASDKRITIPMLGMVQSLNVSVAAAAILYEAQRQRLLAGLYENPRRGLDEATIQALLFERGHHALWRHCLKKGLPYPQIGNEGEVVADASWWQQMQLTPAALSTLRDADEDSEAFTIDN
ncbi:tRNA (guanosine(18)-2'-O)-methyltransferase TrmH [Alteromonas sp. a30]|uniref:tRNA (guanosine(18)-2'-O)-methyltransferase TrmH n=1 Tax=Alteromonas sp. a30 TaxID=2730917 RepID=UPI00227DDF1C|nr:tRNA (guanosine(18)-2'-O)-methyltransferase TrmH [Alteromonas sp. a30]MCY7296249.1 tRNA (guanosine(18)-2'-O)-methyltransferase TrmH [Alteromonas sp. a30]